MAWGSVYWGFRVWDLDESGFKVQDLLYKSGVYGSVLPDSWRPGRFRV